VRVVLDACVLYPAPLRDLLMRLAVAELFLARWTQEIHDEWTRNVLANRPDISPASLARCRELMDCHVPGCVIEGYESLIPGLNLPDANDRHVLAAAIHGGGTAIVTFNLADFPAAALAPFGVEALHPDDFVLNQLDLNPIAALKSIKAMRARWRNPQLSALDLAAAIEKLQLPLVAARLREVAELI